MCILFNVGSSLTRGILTFSISLNTSRTGFIIFRYIVVIRLIRLSCIIIRRLCITFYITLNFNTVISVTKLLLILPNIVTVLTVLMLCILKRAYVTWHTGNTIIIKDHEPLLLEAYITGSSNSVKIGNKYIVVITGCIQS